jgi:acyl carrier protein
MSMTTIAPTEGGMLEGRIRAILRRVARLEGDYSADADVYRELGVKSIAAIDLLLSLEEEFGVAIGDEEFANARSVRALVGLVEEAGQ